MKHVSENRRSAGRAYYQNDDPDVVVQVETRVGEINVRKLKRQLRDHKKARDAIKVPVLPENHEALPREIQKIFEEAQCRAEDERNIHETEGRKIKKFLDEIEAA